MVAGAEQVSVAAGVGTYNFCCVCIVHCMSLVKIPFCIERIMWFRDDMMISIKGRNT